jgi:hypothetical protein
MRFSWINLTAAGAGLRKMRPGVRSRVVVACDVAIAFGTLFGGGGS